jgi:site-specific recombinase XerD
LFSGLRVSELITLDTGKIHTKQIKSKKIWLLSVLGKSRKSEDQQVIPEKFVKELQRYRSCLGLDPWPELPSPLLLSSKGNGPISTRAGAHTIFKEFMNHIGDRLAEINEFDAAQRIKACSVHWLRHSFVTTLLDLTNDMPAVSHLARHRDFKTTMTYDTSEYESLSAQLDQLVESIR